MDNARLMHLNDILQRVSEGRPILTIEDCYASLRQNENLMHNEMALLKDLFNEALQTGHIARWNEPEKSDSFWNWTITAYRRAQQMGITLTDPLGIHPAFRSVSSRITTPLENAHDITSDSLDDDVCGCLARVYGEQARYVIHHEGQPVAAIVPLLDWEMLKDIQLETDPCRWIEWIQTIRERLGWPPATSDE